MLKSDFSESEGVASVQALLNDLGMSDDFIVQTWEEAGGLASLMAYAEIIYVFIAAFFFLLGSTVIVNTTMMTVFERSSEIGTLGALGMEEKDMTRLFFTEALFLAIAGSFAGAVLGSVITLVLSSTGIDYGTAMEGMDLGISTIIYPVFSITTTFLVFLYSVIMAALAALLPCKRVAKIEPVEALRTV